MKRLHDREIQAHFEMPYIVAVNYAAMPFVYELKGHDKVTIDTSPTFGGIAKTFKECRSRGSLFKNLQVWKINTTTGRRVTIAMNPLYI